MQAPDQHRRAPAPILQLLRVEKARQHGCDNAGCERAGILRGGLHGGIEAAPQRRRGLDHIGRRRSHIAAQRKALHQAEQDREDRRGDSDPRIRTA
jgi:hypothetical protein